MCHHTLTQLWKAIAWTLTSISLLLTLGRYYLHWNKNKHLGFDDHFNGLALIFLFGSMITYQLAMPIHQALVTGSKSPRELDLAFYLRLNTANGLLFFCTLYAVKASFLALY
jgi:hypothetical protein